MSIHIKDIKKGNRFFEAWGGVEMEFEATEDDPRR